MLSANRRWCIDGHDFGPALGLLLAILCLLTKPGLSVVTARTGLTQLKMRRFTKLLLVSE